MACLRSSIGAAVLVALAGGALAGDAVTGTASVIDGATMVVAGREVRLADIAVPELGADCVLRGKTLDCGVLARAGLIDITVGAHVVCHEAEGKTHRCTADGYDLSYGQLHAGWAVAPKGAPVAYRSKMEEAKQKQRGLWRATSADGSRPYFSMPAQ